MIDRVTELYYSAKEARAVLGLNEHTFQTWVKAGKIARTKIPGMKQGMYLKRDIERKAQLIASALFLDTTQDLDFHAATVPEIEAETHLAHLIYGKRVLRPEALRARKQLVEKNPESTWLLYDRELLAASINIVPVDAEAIEQFKQGIRGWLLVPAHIKQFAPGEPLDVIVIDLMTTPTVPPEKRHFYALSILKELANASLRQWGDRGVEIRHLYACGSTDAGRKLLRNKWFTELGEPVPGRVIFELLDVLHSDFLLLRPYQEAYSNSLRMARNTLDTHR